MRPTREVDDRRCRPVRILRQSRRLFDCWPLKGASNRLKHEPVPEAEPFSEAFLQLQKSLSHRRMGLRGEEPRIPGTVKLLLPPRQSRGISYRIRNVGLAMLRSLLSGGAGVLVLAATMCAP